MPTSNDRMVATYMQWYFLYGFKRNSNRKFHTNSSTILRKFFTNQSQVSNSRHCSNNSKCQSPLKIFNYSKFAIKKRCMNFCFVLEKNLF